MPELPEVEVIVRLLERKISNLCIRGIIIRRRDLRAMINSDFETRVCGKQIVSVGRVSKYIVITVSTGDTIVMHLGMSGRVRHVESYQVEKHDHVVFQLSNGTHLVFNDARRFGLVLAMDSNQYDVFLQKNSGLDPFDVRFDAAYLAEHAGRTCVKTVLMNSSVVSGIGNIYASEILFKAGVLPQREASSLTVQEWQTVVDETRNTLKLAISYGGSTIRDYQNPLGKSGGYQQIFAVYGRNGKDCRVCGNAIHMDRISGRSTFFCLTCQR